MVNGVNDEDLDENAPAYAPTRGHRPSNLRRASDAAGEQGALAFEQRGHGVHHQVDADGVAMIGRDDQKGLDLKVLRRISDFLGTKPTEAQWATIEKHASFEWMKTNQSKFETFPHAVVPVLEAGAVIRRGKTGAAHEDGMTDEIAGKLRAFGSKIVTDPVALQWLYEGGPLPA